MADKKVTELTTLTSLAASDLFLVTDDVGGTPASRSVRADAITRIGDVRNFGAALDNSTDDATAFQAALDSGYEVWIPYTATGCRINSGLTINPGTRIRSERSDMEINYHGSAGTYLFTCTTSLIRGGLYLDMPMISPGVNGVNGYKFVECRGIYMPRAIINGTSGGNKFAIGILVDDVASPQIGSAWNYFGKIDTLYCSDAGIRFDTQGALPWANRNLVAFHYAETCGIGFDLLDGATNWVNTNPQNCTTGLNLGARADNNTIWGYEESCTTSVALDAGAVRNIINGHWSTGTISGTGSNTTWMTDDKFEVPDLTDGNLKLNPATGNAFIQVPSGNTADLKFFVRDDVDGSTVVMTLNANVSNPTVTIHRDIELDGDLNHDGTNVGFYGTAPVAQQTGVAVTEAAIHAALVNLGLITA